MRNSGLAFLLLPLLAAGPKAARADEKLVIDLPSSRTLGAPPAAAIAPGNSGVPASTAADRSGFAATNRRILSQGPNRHAAAPRSAPSTARNEKVIGRLGVTARECRIYASRGSRSRQLARVTGGTYLALTGSSGEWYGVLMADRTTGWVPKKSVNVLSYEVVGPKQPEPPRYMQLASRGGAAMLSAGQQSLLNEAYRYLGVPYKWGGTSPNGLDCSAFVQRCFSTLGIGLPRTAAEQYSCGMPVDSSELQAGDRLYFANKNGHISHTGIYVGDGYFIHASSSHHGVAVSNLTESMYSRMYAGARR